MDRPTVEVYERAAVVYGERRPPRGRAAARALAAAVPVGVPRGDLGCGPGLHVPDLGAPVVAVDAAAAMLRQVEGAWRVQADLVDLPLAGGSLGGAWASKCYQHLPHEQLPGALAELQRVTSVGAPVVLTMFLGEGTRRTAADDDDLPGRLFSLWTADRLADLLVGAGFEVTAVEEVPGDWPQLRVAARRTRSLADVVGPGMRLLVCGLNPSLYAADLGVNFARPGNRFWPAMREAGLATVDRDPRHLLRHHGIGMTDLVKRASVAADVLTADEYAAGLGRVERLCEWLRPGALYLVGLAGWRAARDRRAAAGWQPEPLGGVPVYVGPSTSGLNASTQLPGHVDHLRAAVSGPPG